MLPFIVQILISALITLVAVRESKFDKQHFGNALLLFDCALLIMSRKKNDISYEKQRYLHLMLHSIIMTRKHNM